MLLGKSDMRGEGRGEEVGKASMTRWTKYRLNNLCIYVIGVSLIVYRLQQLYCKQENKCWVSKIMVLKIRSTPSA